MDMFTFVGAFRTELWNFIINLLILTAAITLISIFVVWFITESIEKIMIEKQINKIVKWVISTIIVYLITFLLISLFRKMQINTDPLLEENKLVTLYYILLIGIFALSVTMFVYLTVFKNIGKFRRVADVKMDTLLLDVEEDKLKSQNNILKNKIARDQLIIKKEIDGCSCKCKDNGNE